MKKTYSRKLSALDLHIRWRKIGFLLKKASVLSWKQLVHEKSKTLMAITGVMFACILVFMQLGFRDSLFRSATTLPRHLKGDLFIVHSFTQAVWRGVSFSKREAFRVYGHPEVKSAIPVYMTLAQWKLCPHEKTTDHKKTIPIGKETILALGFPPYSSVFKGLDERPEKELTWGLSVKDTIFFDEKSKPEFGPIPQWLAEGGQVDVEVNDKRKRVIGTFSLGASFAAAGTIVMSDQTFLSIMPHRSVDAVDLLVVQLKNPQQMLKVQKELAERLPHGLKILTYDELVHQEEHYWRTRTSIGFTFGMGVVIGLVVGMVIVYQILFTNVLNHMKEYATLAAIGYPVGFLRLVVISSGLWMAILGFFPGLLGALGLYQLTQSVTRLPMVLPFSTVISVGWMIGMMCAFSGILAARKLSKVDPAQLF